MYNSRHVPRTVRVQQTEHNIPVRYTKVHNKAHAMDTTVLILHKIPDLCNYYCLECIPHYYHVCTGILNTVLYSDQVHSLTHSPGGLDRNKTQSKNPSIPVALAEWHRLGCDLDPLA